MEFEQIKDLSEKHPIIFFDGVCRLCNGFVNYVIRHDPDGKLKFCALQDENAVEIRKEFGLTENLDTVIGLYRSQIYSHSDVVFMVARQFRAYRFILPLQRLPISFRNYIYRLIAKNRYRWFGKQETCMVPSSDVFSRFI